MKYLLFILLLLPCSLKAQDFPSFSSPPESLARGTIYTTTSREMRIVTFVDTFAQILINHFTPCKCIDVYKKKKKKGQMYVLIVPISKKEEIITYFKKLE